MFLTASKKQQAYYGTSKIALVSDYSAKIFKSLRKGAVVLRTIRRDGRPPTDTRIGTRLTGAEFSTPDASNAPVIGHQRLHSKLSTTVSASM